MSANLLLSTSRFLLFGPSDAEQITLKSIVKRKAVNVGRSVMGMPPVKGPGFWELLKKKSWELWCRFWYPKRGLGLPEDMPCPPRSMTVIGSSVWLRSALERCRVDVVFPAPPLLFVIAIMVLVAIVVLPHLR